MHPARLSICVCPLARTTASMYILTGLAQFGKEEVVIPADILPKNKRTEIKEFRENNVILRCQVLKRLTPCIMAQMTGRLLLVLGQVHAKLETLGKGHGQVDEAAARGAHVGQHLVVALGIAGVIGDDDGAVTHLLLDDFEGREGHGGPN